MKVLGDKKLLVAGVVASLVVLGGCDFFSKKDTPKKKTHAAAQVQADVAKVSEQETLLSIEGKPVITVAQFEDHLKKIIEANPQASQMLDAVPDMKYNIFSGMASQELLKTWVRKSDIVETAEYKQDLEMMHKLVEFELARKYFQEDLEKNVKISASDVKKYYDSHKASIPDLVISPAGVKSVGVSFDNQAKADAFAAQPEIEKNFKQLAQSQGSEVVDFGLVTDYNLDVDKKIREKVTKAFKTPSIMKVEGDDKKFWICLVTEKQQAVYRPLAEVQDGIEQALKSEKLQMLFGHKVEALRTVYHTEENRSYFGKAEAEELLAQAEEAPKQETSKTKSSSRVA